MSKSADASTAIAQLYRCEGVFDKASRGEIRQEAPTNCVSRLCGHAAQMMQWARRPELFYTSEKNEELLILLCRLLYEVQICKTATRKRYITVNELFRLKNLLLEVLVEWPRDRLHGARIEVARSTETERWLSVLVHCPAAHKTDQWYHWPTEVIHAPTQSRIAEICGSWPPSKIHPKIAAR